MLLTQTTSITVEFAESALPLAAAALWEVADRLEPVVTTLAPRLEYLSQLDAAAAALLPVLRGHVEEYYESAGPQLAELFSAEEVGKLDIELAARIELCAAVLGAVERCPPVELPQRPARGPASRRRALVRSLRPPRRRQK
jgi:hypothetical protein